MEDTTKNIDSTGRVFFDIVRFLFLLILVAAISNVTPVERGFFCDDQSIKYPFKVDYFDWNMFVAFSTITIFMVMVLTELPHYLRAKNDTEDTTFSVCGIQVWVYVIQLYKAMVPFIFGILLNIALVSVLKVSVGRLRPNFMAGCRPNITTEMCMEDGYYKYVTDFTCMGSDDFNPTVARGSFPSAHTAHAFVCAIYLILYLQIRMTWECSHLPRHILQVTSLCLAYYVGALRINAHVHHPTDVLAGVVHGTLIGFIVGYIFSGLFRKEKTIQKDASEQSSEYSSLK